MSKAKSQQPKKRGSVKAVARATQAAEGMPADSSARTARRDALRAQQRIEAAKQARMRRIMIAVGTVIALVIIGVVAVPLVQNHLAAKEQADERLDLGEQIVPKRASSDEGGLMYGDAPESAPLVQVWSDFQCPSCAIASGSVDRHLETLADAGELRLDYRFTHRQDVSRKNDRSKQATIATSCAAEYGEFSTYAHLVFARTASTNSAPTDDQLRDTIAKEAGLSGGALNNFQQCFDERATTDFVVAMQDNQPSTVTGTPTFLVNGTEITFSAEDTLEQVRQKVNEAVNQAGD